MKSVKDMNEVEVVQELMSMSLRARVRAMLYHHSAHMEQLEAQPKPPSAMECRRLEFAVAEKIIAEVRSKPDVGQAPAEKKIERVRIRRDK